MSQQPRNQDIDDENRTIGDLIAENFQAMRSDLGRKLFLKFFNDIDNGLAGNAVGDTIASYNHWYEYVLPAQFSYLLNMDIELSGVIYKIRVSSVIVEESSLTARQAKNTKGSLKSKVRVGLQLLRDETIIQTVEFTAFEIPAMVGSKLEKLIEDPENVPQYIIDETDEIKKRQLLRIHAKMGINNPVGYFIHDGADIVLLMRDQMRTNLPTTDMNKGRTLSRYTSVGYDSTRAVMLHRKEDKEVSNDNTRIYITVDKLQHEAAKSGAVKKEPNWLHVSYILNYLATMSGVNIGDVPSIIAMFTPKIPETVREIAYTIVNTRDKSSFNNVVNEMKRSTKAYYSSRKEITRHDVFEWVVEQMYVHIDIAAENEVYKYSEDDQEYRFSHLYKLYTLCWQLGTYLETLMGEKLITNKDNWAYKKISQPSFKLQEFTNKRIRAIRRTLANEMEKMKRITNQQAIANKLVSAVGTIRHEEYTTEIMKNIKPAQSNDKHTDHYAERLETANPMKESSHLTRIKPPANNRLAEKARHVRMEQVGYVCPTQTPESERCGIVKNKAISCRLSHDNYYNYLFPETIIEILGDEYPVEQFIDDDIYTGEYKAISLNGIILGFVEEAAYHKLRQAKITGRLPFDSCIFNSEVIEVYTDNQRPTRPLLVVEDGKLKFDELDDWESMSWEELLKGGYVEYVDVRETMNYTIAMYHQDLKYRGDLYDRLITTGRQIAGTYKGRIGHELAQKQIQQYTHAEIDPLLILGISSAHTPMASHNQPARNTYQAGMTSQAMSGETPDCRYCNSGSSKYLANPVPPLVESTLGSILGITAPGTGEHVVLAVNVSGGYNQEDSITMSKSSIERGLFTYSVVKRISHVLEQGETFGIPEDMISKVAIRNKDGTVRINSRYEAIVKRISDKEIEIKNYPLIGSMIKEGMVIIPVTSRTGGVAHESNKVASIDDVGVVERVSVSANANGNNVMTVCIREVRNPTNQDKFTLRAAQKGTIALTLPDEDMYWDPVSRVKVDALINPHSFPSRMTMATLIELVGGLSSTLTGVKFDATTFRPVDFNELEKVLLMHGFSRSFKTHLYDKDGHKVETPIYIAPAYYQALPHHVYDKRKVRGSGGFDKQYRQPKKKRRERGGGAMRFGEMEAEAIFGHGATMVLLDRMNYCSDSYNAIHCATCNRFGYINRELQIAKCGFCESRNVSVMTQSYVTYYFIGLLAILGLDLKLNVVFPEQLKGTLPFSHKNITPFTVITPSVSEELTRFGKLLDINEILRSEINKLDIQFPEILANLMYESMANSNAELGSNVFMVSEWKNTKQFIIDLLSGFEIEDMAAYLGIDLDEEEEANIEEQYYNQIDEVVDGILDTVNNEFTKKIELIEDVPSYQLNEDVDGNVDLTVEFRGEKYHKRIPASRKEALIRGLEKYYKSVTEINDYIAALMLRYLIFDVVEPNLELSLPDKIKGPLYRELAINSEMLASPFNYDLTHNSDYFSMFNDIDVIYGSHGNIFNSRIDSGSVLVNIPYVPAIYDKVIDKVLDDLEQNTNSPLPLRYTVIFQFEQDDEIDLAIIERLHSNSHLHTDFKANIVIGDNNQDIYLAVLQNPIANQQHNIDTEALMKIFE